MQCITKVIYKEHHLVEAKEVTFNRKTTVIQEHFDVIVDEISDGRINQQKLWLDSKKTEIVEKLNNLTMYEQTVIIINVEFFDNKPNKIKILDVVTDETEKQQLKDIIKRY